MPPSRSVDRRGLIAGVIGGVAGLFVVAGLVWLLAAPSSTASLAPEPPGPSWAPPADAPVAASSPGAGIAGLVDPGWAKATAKATGVPERALLAYAGAAIVKQRTMPACGLSWNTLAGIGEVESDHGRHGGSSIAPDGTVAPAIYGPDLDGNGVALIPDSDGGAIDGDAQGDRAAGPMQLIPQTWRNWHTDGNADGKEDPQNIDDAVMASANYLCRASTALGTEAGWRKAIAAYNDAGSYGTSVARAAIEYADDADR